MMIKSYIAGAFIIMLLLPFGAIAQNEVRHYADTKIRVDYNLQSGMLNGHYVSYYKNGNKKAEGDFDHNNRSGKWDSYDSTGKLAIERIYTTAYEYNVTVPAPPDGPAKLLSASVYTPARNVDGYYEYFFLAQRAVVWSKRVWGYVWNKENPVLGRDNRLFKLLYAQLLKGNLNAYKNNSKDRDNTFNKPIKDFTAATVDTANIEVTGFLFKEDWFMDNDRNEMEHRILGICPIAKIKNSNDTAFVRFAKDNLDTYTKDTIGLFWIYYPQARKYLAADKVTVTGLISPIQNLDDVFFWKYYNEDICLESPIYGGHTSSSKDGWDVIMKMIDLEHDVWMGKSSTEMRGY